MNDHKLQEELSSAYDLPDLNQLVDNDSYDSYTSNEVVVENVNPLNQIIFHLSSEDQERLTDEAKFELNTIVQSEINRILDEANRKSKGSEKTLKKDVEHAAPKGHSKARSNSSALGFALIGGVISQAIAAAINLNTNTSYSIVIAVFITLLGGMLAFRR